MQRILGTLYSSAPDGLCGNDDCGQMSAWYVLSMLGRYPLCPGRSEGEGVSSIPKTIVVNPWFETESEMFADSLRVAIGGEGSIWYRTSPAEDFRPYVSPFFVSDSCTMEAYSELDGRKSFVSRCSVNKIFTDRDISISSRCSSQYTAGGPDGLIDRRRGGINWRTGGWQGYQGSDFEAVVDLRSVRQIESMGAGFLQDARSWIWMPKEVVFSVSDDGEHFSEVFRSATPVDSRDMKVQTWDCTAEVSLPARYVKVQAAKFGSIPSWHPGAGYPAFIFIDEIFVDAE